jgi:hypothetical protein
MINSCGLLLQVLYKYLLWPTSTLGVVNYMSRNGESDKNTHQGRVIDTCQCLTLGFINHHFLL